MQAKAVPSRFGVGMVAHACPAISVYAPSVSCFIFRQCNLDEDGGDFAEAAINRESGMMDWVWKGSSDR
jgi:hypothetical protein